MSGVTNGQDANQTNFNNAFMKANGDTSTIGKVDLNNADAVSGTAVSNLQKSVNSVWSYLGGLINQAKDYLPTWTNNNGLTSTDSVKDRVDTLSGKFHATTGHSHSGAAGDAPQISVTDIADIPLKGVLVRGQNIAAPTGSTYDVTSIMNTQVASNNETTEGVAVNAPYNEIIIKRLTGSEGDSHIEDTNGNIVFGRLTESAGTWTLSFYTDVAGVETAYTMTAGDTSAGIKWWYTKLFTIDNLPIYPEEIYLPSDNYTQDILDASATQSGKVSTGTQSFAGTKTFTDTTQSTNKDTGAVVVEGGVGIEKNLVVGQELAVNGLLRVDSYAQFESYQHLREIAAPSTPAAGFRRFYAKSDGVYELDSAGVEKRLGSGGYETSSAGVSKTITAASVRNQFLTGATIVSFYLPVTTTLTVGDFWYIYNDTSNNVVLYTSAGSDIIQLAPKSFAIVTCILASGTTPASWNWKYLSPVSDYTSTITSGSPVALTWQMRKLQIFTGGTAQTVVLPSTSPIYNNRNFLGDYFTIANRSTAIITVNSNSGSLVRYVYPNEIVDFYATQTGSTGPTDWQVSNPISPFAEIISLDGQAATPSSPSAGYYKLYVKDDTGKLALLNSSGAEQVIGGNAEVNFITNGDAEGAASTIFTSYKDTSSPSRPTDGTGGSPTQTSSSVSSTTPLDGLKHFLLYKAAANAQGEGHAVAFTVPLAHRAKVLEISFDYIVDSGTFAAGSSSTDSDLIVYIYDVTNSQLIEPSNFKLLSNSTTTPTRFQATFQSSSSGSSYRLLFHTATTSASSYQLKVDNIKVAPAIRAYGTPVTDWVSCTVTGSWVTNTTYTALRRRVGDEYEYDIKVATSGAPTATTLTVTLDATIDTNKITSIANFNPDLGLAVAVDSATQYYHARVRYASSNSVGVFVEPAGGSYIVPASVDATVPFTFGASDFVHMKFSVPIVGLSSSVQMSDQTDTRVVSLKANRSTTQTIATSTATDIIYNASVEDSHGAYNSSTGIFTVPVAGKYSVSAQAIYGSASWTGLSHYNILYILKNGVIVATTTNWLPVTGTYAPSSMSVTQKCIDCKAGDTLKIQTVQNSGGNRDLSGDTTAHYISIVRESGPSAIAASEAINVKYRSTAGTSIANNTTTIIDFATKDHDTHSAVTTGASWKFTAPTAGKYHLSASVLLANNTGWAVTEQLSIMVYKNGVLDSYLCNHTDIGSASLVARGLSGATTVAMVAGDYLDLRIIQISGGAIALNSTNGTNVISIDKVG